MKHLVTALLALLIFGCSPSENEAELQSEFVDEMSSFDLKVYDMIQAESAKTNSGSSAKNESSKLVNEDENRVYIAPMYSNDIRPGITWFAYLYVPETSLLMRIDFPKNGDDRVIVFSENEMMVNFTSQGPRILLFDLENGGRVKYGNWCMENQTGLYTMRGNSTYNAIDQDNDGTIDLYHWGPNAEGTEIDKNFLIHVKSTLTSNRCADPTGNVEFSYILQSQNGRLRETATIK